MRFKFINITLATLLLGVATVGCGGVKPEPKAVTDKSSKPKWVLNPNFGGKRGAIGVAGNTYDQRVSTKRKLAIQRALDELAMQQGVKVDLTMQKSEHVANDTASTKMDTKTTYKTTNGSSLKAHIAGVWENHITDELYVWLVLD